MVSQRMEWHNTPIVKYRDRLVVPRFANFASQQQYLEEEDHPQVLEQLGYLLLQPFVGVAVEQCSSNSCIVQLWIEYRWLAYLSELMRVVVEVPTCLTLQEDEFRGGRCVRRYASVIGGIFLNLEK
jgi:hypothetical protein